MTTPLLRLARCAALLLLLAASASADVVHLKDGRSLEGTVTEETAEKVVLETRFGPLEFARKDVLSIDKGKTKGQEFDERWKQAKSAEDFYELGKWADESKLKGDARKSMKRAIKLDAGHPGARKWLGFVLHKKVWMTPEERDIAVAREEAAEMLKKGLVQHEGKWVTALEKENYDRGNVFVDGRWLSPDEAKRARGLELFGGEWMPKMEAVARKSADIVAQKGDVSFTVVVGENALLAGPFDASFLQGISTGIDSARTWFNELYEIEAGLPLLGGRFAEFYLFNRDSTPYKQTTEHFASQTTTLPETWAAAVKKTHGFLYWDPYCVSSARVWGRPEENLIGHCYHHWGHLMVNRLNYDGRLLPPWYDEGFAALVEFLAHGKNDVFCLARSSGSQGTGTAKNEYAFESKDFRRGGWRKKLREGLEAKEVQNFDKLAQKEFGMISLLDTAQAMAILEWLALEEGATARFHAVLRKHAPQAPRRVIPRGRDRQAVYDEAFQAAVKLSWRAADQAWRQWFLNAK
jgi:hypothetical protein